MLQTGMFVAAAVTILLAPLPPHVLVRSLGGLFALRRMTTARNYFFSSAAFSAPGITFFSGAFRCSSVSGCGTGFRGSI